MKGRFSKVLAMVALMAGAFALSGAARADHVRGETPYSYGLPQGFFGKGDGRRRDSSLDTPVHVWGASLRVDELALSSAGTLSIRLSDLEFPSALESLSLLVTDLDGVWQRLDGPGDLLVSLTGPAKLFVAVFARSEGRRQPGVYYVHTDFTPVPLPAAAWLLLSGLGGLSLLRRKRAAGQ